MADNAEMTIVEMPDGTEIEFPSGTSQDVMQKAVSDYHQSTLGLGGIGRDIVAGLKNVPGEVGEAIQGLQYLPGETLGAAEQLVTDPFRTIQNLIVGAGKTGEAIGSIPSRTEEYLRQKNILDPSGSPVFKKQPALKWEQMLGMGNPQPGDTLTQSVSGYGPFLELGAAKGASLPRTVGRQAKAAAAYEAVQGRNPVSGAITQGLLDVPFAAAGKALMPAKGNVNAQQLAENMRVSEGTDVNLGDIIGSGALKKVQENLLDQSLGSGSENRYAKLEDVIRRRGENLLSGRLKEPPSDLSAEGIKSTLVDTYEKARQQKQALYEPVNKLAEQEGFSLDLENSTKYAKSVADRIYDSPLIKDDPAVRKLLRDALNITGSVGEREVVSPILDEYGQQFSETETFSPKMADVSMLAQRLDQKSGQLSSSTAGIDKSTRSMYTTLAKLLRQDIREEIGKKGSAELQNAFEDATSNYRENYAPFNDEEVARLKDPTRTSDTIVNDIIQPGQLDKFSRLKKIQDLMPDENKYDLGYAYLAPAFKRDGTLDLKKLSSLLDKLKPQQFKTLYPGIKTRGEINDYIKLRKMSEEALSTMANPKTGQRALQSLMQMLQMGGAGMGAFNFSHSGIIPALTSAAIPMLAPPLMSRALSNPTAKGIYLRELLRQKRGGRARTDYPSAAVRFGAEAMQQDEQ